MTESVPRSSLWARWLRVSLLVGFVLDVLLAIRLEAIRKGLPPGAFWPVSQPSAELIHVPPGERVVFFVAALFLFIGWARAVAREIGSPGALSLLFGESKRWQALPTLDFGPSTWQLALTWRILVPVTLGGWVLLVGWALIYRPTQSLAGFVTELVLTVLLAASALVTAGLVEVILRRGTTAPVHVAPPRRPVVPVAARRAIPAPVPAPPASANETCAGCGNASGDATCRACGATRAVRGFRVERVLATRPHGWTYLVRDAEGTRAVLKEVRFSRAPDPKVIDAFQREAALLRDLRIPGIPSFRDAFEVMEPHDVRLYIAMEWIDGLSLRDVLDRAPLPESSVRRIVVELLGLLITLHERAVPIVHRDIKPSNLLRQRSGKIALVDFGVARGLLGRATDATLVGTVGYMPPEQLAGQVDCTSDLYALGVTAMTLLTGRDPAERLTDAAVPAMPDLPVSRSFGRFLRRLAAPLPRKRFPSARKALEVLEKGDHSARVPALIALSLVCVGALGVALRLRYRSAAGLPEPLEPRTVATFPGGVVTLDEFRQEVQSLPLSFRKGSSQWEQEVVESLATLKQLVGAARKQGLRSDFRHDRASLLAEARALALREGVLGDDLPSEEQRSRYLRWLERRVVKPTIDAGALRANPMKDLPLPTWTGTGREEESFTLDLDTGRCLGKLHRSGWYEARCERGVDFFDLGPRQILFAELSAGSGRPFIHSDILALTPAFELAVKAVAPHGSGDLLPPEEPADPGAVFRISLRSISIEGSVRREMAELTWNNTSAPFLRCLGSVLWANRRPGPEGDLKLGLNVLGLRATVVAGSLDDSAIGPTDHAQWSAMPCTTVFTDRAFLGAGPGTVTYNLHVRVVPPPER